MRSYLLEADLWLPRAIEEVFAFFSDASNLEAITPPWLHFRICPAAPRPLRAGSRLAYRLRWRGLVLRWQTEITIWEPPRRFVDVQRRGPYRQWVHEHRFQPEREGTRVHDWVSYALPGGILAPLLHRLLVGPDLQAIFTYRQERISALLARP